MCATKRTANRRDALTLIELLVVIAIILAIAALAAAFAPRVSEDTNLSRAIDGMEQWLLTAKMRAKRDGLATGVRFVSVPGDVAGTFSQFQYIQQPDPLSGGWMSAPSGTPTPNGGILASASGGTVSFANVDFSTGGAVVAQGQVQAGDYLELRDGGVYLIGSVSASVPSTTLQLATTFGQSLTITTPTSNYRILRQPRILIGETPLQMPNNFVVDFNAVPGTNPPVPGTNVANGPSGAPEILFSPTGSIVGTNAGNSKLWLYIHDVTQNPPDITKAGIVSVQSRTGFIGAYSVAPGSDPFYFAESGRESGL
jgi:prepilin-type N-terminal cleavage/methylation domain-containing protein